MLPFIDAANVAQDMPDSSTSVYYLGQADGCVETTQLAVVTPEVRPTLNPKICRIPVQAPKSGEMAVQIAWTGLPRYLPHRRP